MPPTITYFARVGLKRLGDSSEHMENRANTNPHFGIRHSLLKCATIDTTSKNDIPYVKAGRNHGFNSFKAYPHQNVRIKEV